MRTFLFSVIAKPQAVMLMDLEQGFKLARHDIFYTVRLCHASDNHESKLDKSFGDGEMEATI